MKFYTTGHHTMEYYTTDQVAKLTPYKTRRTLLQALHANHNDSMSSKKIYLSRIWQAKFKFGKRWLFKKDEIHKILEITVLKATGYGSGGVGSSENGDSGTSIKGGK